MCESMTYQISGDEEDLIVKSIRMRAYEGKHKKKSWLIQVPAAAVIPEWLALFGMIGRKGYVGGVTKDLLDSLKLANLLKKKP